MVASKEPKVNGQAHQNRSLIRVSVHVPGGAHYTGDAKVQIRRQGQVIELQRERGMVLYEAMVEPGTYTLDVTAVGWSAPSRSLDIGQEGKTASVYLGRENWPTYRMGESIIPFEPLDDVVAVAFEFHKPDQTEVRNIARRLRDNLGLAPFDAARGGDVPFAVANGSVLLFQLPAPGERARMRLEIPKFLDREARIGIPVDLAPGQVKVLDDQFVVRFRDRFSADQVQTFIKAADATILRDFIQAKNAHLIKFQSGDYRDHLRTIEDWFGQDLLIYGEPDLLVEIADGAYPVDDPDDPSYPAQKNLTLQGVDAAWRFLNGLNLSCTLGSPTICIATLDQGVETGHPDIGDCLTDGSTQIAECFDFSNLQPCSAAGYHPANNHGMGVYGIIAARTNNKFRIAGIAPNTRQVCLKRPDLTSSQTYADVLLWAAGFQTGSPVTGWPAEPIGTPAHIFNCSHGQKGLPLSRLVEDAFIRMTTEGRSGLGTVIIYSAGNDSSCITGALTMAAHPCTLAIANSKAPNSQGIERYDQTSNYGPEIDICARGTDVRSLDLDGDEQVFGGTSAAAPSVAAAVALMLTANPNLTWTEVRTILRDTAVKIDYKNTNQFGKWVNGFSQRYGYGRLNVGAAVEAAHEYAT
jgi:subtilisin family serine protease